MKSLLAAQSVIINIDIPFFNLDIISHVMEFGASHQVLLDHVVLLMQTIALGSYLQKEVLVFMSIEKGHDNVETC